MEGGCVAFQPAEWAGDYDFIKVVLGPSGCSYSDLVLVLEMGRVADWCIDAHGHLVEMYIDIRPSCLADVLQDAAVG